MGIHDYYYVPIFRYILRTRHANAGSETARKAAFQLVVAVSRMRLLILSVTMQIYRVQIPLASLLHGKKLRSQPLQVMAAGGYAA